MAPRRLLLLLLLPACCRAQSMSMGGVMPGGGAALSGVGLSDAADARYMAPPSAAVDGHASSVVLDWNAVLRGLARGVPFGDWAFEDPSPANGTSRVGRFLDAPLPAARAARAAALANAAMREALAPLVAPGTPGALLGPGWGGTSASDLWDAVQFPGAAASFAAHYVLSALFPHRQQAVFDRQAPGFDAVLARHLTATGYGLASGGLWCAPVA
jgi:hypothetical protein